MTKCFRCGGTEERGSIFSEKTSTTPSTICMSCFIFLKLTGAKFLHEKAKIEQNDPNYDIMKDGDYIKNWNKRHPLVFGSFGRMRNMG